jgi:heme A synthase
MNRNRSFAKFAWGTLILNVCVVLWGAYVRASGSGAGCGSHWPLCNGVVIPHPERLATLIEFIHRGTSGAALILVLALFIFALRAYPKRHAVRWASLAAVVFVITEALVGAGLVLFGLVEENTSVARAVTGAVHLGNTYLLLASLTLTAWCASGGSLPVPRVKDITSWLLGLGLLGFLVLGMSGAVTALGDTLYPSGSLAAGLEQDFSSAAHFLIRIRVVHPLIAVAVGFYLIFVVGWISRREIYQGSSLVERSLLGLILAQLVAGAINVYLLAPIWMQLLHLLIADLLWINLVLYTALVLGKSVPEPISIFNRQTLPRQEIP